MTRSGPRCFITYDANTHWRAVVLIVRGKGGCPKSPLAAVIITPFTLKKKKGPLGDR